MSRKVIEKEKTFPCITVEQNFGVFYACSIPAKELIEICEPVRAEVLEDEIDDTPLDISIKKSTGTQREKIKNRPEQIRDYIRTGVAAFPNSIIVGANISEEGFLLDKDKRTWTVDNNILTISESSLSAAIIDGQHRLSGFELLDKGDSALDEQLLCSIYLDIPMTYHAQIFSTINSTQRRVHKNLIYQLYQIDMDEKEPQYWSQEVLAVYLARALGVDKESALLNRVVLAIDNEKTLKDWRVSLSVLVEGILKLISEKPTEDRDLFYSKRMEQKTREDLSLDKSVWRRRYLDKRDKSIYKDLLTFFNVCYEAFDDNSAYKSSVGCSALLEALNSLLLKDEVDFKYISEILSNAINSIKQKELPLDKVSKNKALLRDVLIAAFLRKSNLREHNFYRKQLSDFDIYLSL